MHFFLKFTNTIIGDSMEEEGLSLLDLWKLIVKRKFLVLILFGFITISTLLFILYIYNPLRSSYEVSFSYQWEGIENNKYANGMVFNEYELISLTNLNDIKNSKEEFLAIDTEKLSERITLTKDEDGMYSMRLPGAFFSSDLQAKAFIERLIYLPYHKALNLTFDFTANIKGYTRSNKIAHKLTYLKNQINLILSGYQAMISHFGDIQIGDSNLSGLLRQTEVFQINDDLKNYEYLAYKNAYMTKEEYQDIVRDRDVLLTEQKLLRERKEVLLESLRNIYSNSNGNTYLDTSIANYLNNLHTLDTRLMKISEDLKLMETASLGNYSEEKSEAFLKNLEGYRDKLESLTKEYTDTVKFVLKENTFLNMKPIQIQSKMSIWLAIPLSIFLGGFLSCICGLLFSLLQENRKKNKVLD